MQRELSASELSDLVHRVFVPTPRDKALAILVDLPDSKLPDHDGWKERREMAAGWARQLLAAKETNGLDISLVLYRNVRANNADLPEMMTIWDPLRPLPETADDLAAFPATSVGEVLTRHQLALAPTELSATAPLKMLCPLYACRAATMPGFSPGMIPALRLDYTEVNRRVTILKELLDRAVGADFVFEVSGQGTFDLRLDLRHRQGHASGGLLPQPNMAGNLPSGEAYIVPYEGEIPGDTSGSKGLLPVQLDGEIVLYRIENNRLRWRGGSES